MNGMREVDYEYIAFDAQYFLYRNYSALKGRASVTSTARLAEGEGDTSVDHVITTYNFDEHDLVKQFFWTIAKMIRDHYSCHKVILLWDYPPYHKTTLLPDYKGTRNHPCQEKLDEIDPEIDPISYLQMKEDIRIEEVKSKAKWWIITNLGKFGMPSVMWKGWEADDLACVFSRSTKVHNSQLKSAICSADGDWMYWITDKVDFLHFNKKEAWTYDDVVAECEGMTEKLGIDLFTLKSVMDSTFYSHNDLMKTTSLGWSRIEDLYEDIKSEKYEYINDVDRLLKNLKSFEYWNYPEYNLVNEFIESIVNSDVKESGIKGDMEVYGKLKTLGFSVSYPYAQNYLETITEEYYYHGNE